MNDPAPNHLRRALAVSIGLLCALLCAVALAEDPNGFAGRATLEYNPSIHGTARATTLEFQPEREKVSIAPANAVKRSASISLPAAPVAPPPNTVTWYWDWPADLAVNGFAIYSGPDRSALTNRIFTTATNSAFTVGLCYGLASVTTNGKESALIYWPSNAIYVPQMEYTTDLVTWLPGPEFPEVTNTPVKHVRMVNKFKRWE